RLEADSKDNSVSYMREGAMGLIPSHRHSVADLEHWSKMEVFDAMRAKSPALEVREAKAQQVNREFAAQGPCYVGESRDKDSGVVVNLAFRTGVGPLAWFPAGIIENPDCAAVRDAFLRMFPDAQYIEIEASGPIVGPDITGHDGAQREFEIASRSLGERYISGVRAEESQARSLRMKRWGASTTNTCAPIGWWKGEEVFAYLHKYNLPVHPAYAMTFGGVLDRKRVRVGTIGGYRGTGRGRKEWERHYYGDVLEAINEHSGA